MKNKERALAHLRSALRYEKRGLGNKARAHFGRAMHYGGVGVADGLTLDQLPNDIQKKIISSALDGPGTHDFLLALLGSSKGERATTLEALADSLRLVPEMPADQIHKSPLYPIYLVSLHETAKMPTPQLIQRLVEYNNGTDRPTNIKAALHVIIMRKWYLACPYRFHDIVGILHDPNSNEETKGVCRTLLEDFISYLSGPSTPSKSTVLHRPEIIEHICRIKEGSFKPAAVTDLNIRALVKKYKTQGVLVPDAAYGPLCLWKTGQAKNMGALFQRLQWREEWDVRLWDTRGVNNMYTAFQNCNGLLAGVEHWSVMSSENMRFMFSGAAGFDRDISRWDTSNVKDMGYMFNEAIAFNRLIGNWDTRNVTDMEGMFRNAAAFNQPIGKWDTRNVTNMSFMFADAVAFNQNIRGWNMTNVETTHYMYTGATAMEEKHKTAEGTAR
jgi:surface protein